MNSDKHTNIYT